MIVNINNLEDSQLFKNFKSFKRKLTYGKKVKLFQDDEYLG